MIKVTVDTDMKVGCFGFQVGLIKKSCNKDG